MNIKGKILAVCMVAFFLGCATGTKPESGEAAKATSAAKEGKVTLSLPPAPLDAVVRQIGAEAGGGIVLMLGLGEHITQGFDFRGDPFGEVVEEIAQETKLKTHAFEGYHFIYAQGYEGLLELNLASLLDPKFAEKRISFSVGSNTYLYNALNLLSHSLGTTIVADNLIADARCGEIALEEAPIAPVIEALLRSARVPQEQLSVLSTPEYLFLGAKNLGEHRDAVENLGADYLDKRVNLYLPRPVSGKEAMPFYNEITTLGEVRASMAEQLGVRVELGVGLEKLPINPCVMNGVTVQTALNLLVWQWPVTNVKCQAGAGGVAFVEVR